jgi:SET domain-containing protein 6
MSFTLYDYAIYENFGPSLPSFNHKTDGEHVHFTSASDDSDGEDHDELSAASADDQSTIENPTISPSGYIKEHMHVCH